MKKITLKLACVLLAIVSQSITAQVTTVIAKDSIFTNTHWTCDKQYLLKGYVYVVNNTTLTIDSGVIIRGDKNTKGSLIIERGAKIFAQGTKYHPIVMTSDQAMGQRNYGDWGGLILCGKSPVNWNGNQSQVEGGPRSLYGGTNPHDNSGVLSYVRCEFAGIAFSPNNEINGITFCGVGDATQIDHCQVSYSGDDSYEWFGGTVNSKYLIAFRGWDDDFDTDNGYSGMNQFGVGLRDPFAADQSGSKGFESDSYQSGTKTGLAGDTTGLTKCVFCNYTMIGGVTSPGSTAYDPQFVSAAHIRRGSAISIINSVIGCYPAGVLYDESSSSFGSTTRNMEILGAAGDSISQIRGTMIAGTSTNNAPGPRKDVFYVKDGARSITPTNVWADTVTGSPFAPYPGPFDYIYSLGVSGYPKNSNKYYASMQNGVRLTNPFSLGNPSPNFIPTTTSPIAYNSTALPAYAINHWPAGKFPGNVYPFNPNLPINTDTSGWFVNYNCPSFPPTWNSGRTKNPFFTKVNYVGGFSGTQTTADNWMLGWTNFDPNNTDYSNAVCTLGTGIRSEFVQKTYLQAFPNPTKDDVTVKFSLEENYSNATIELINPVGSRVDFIDLKGTIPGLNSTTVNIKNLTEGVYFLRLTVDGNSKTTLLAVTK